MRRGDCFLRRGLKIHHIEGLVGGRNDRVALLLQIPEPPQKVFLLRRLRTEKLCQRASQHARAGDQRAGEKHLEEFPSRSSASANGIHGLSPSANLAAKCSAGAGRVRGKLLSNRGEKQVASRRRESFRSEEHTSELQSQSNLVCR